MTVKNNLHMTSRGVFTVSIDLELAWGECDKPVETISHHALHLERDIIRRLLKLFSEHRIPATWAIVGHLLLTDCDWTGEKVHPEISRPIAKNNGRDWFFRHPKTRNDPLWYGRDLIEWIRKTSPEQEIGSHSFCHMPYDELLTNRDAVRTDIEAAKRLHTALNLPFETFVFPRNLVGHRDLLVKAGVRAYRGTVHPWYYSLPSKHLRRLLNFVCCVIPIPPRTVKATFDEIGLLNIPDSMLLLGRNGIRGLVPPKSLIRKGIAGLNRAAEWGEIFHLRFHPSNFAYAIDKQFGILEAILKHATLLRGKNRLEILSMGDVRRRTVN